MEKDAFHKYTFAPQVNANSDRIVSAAFRGEASFFQRQKLYGVKRSMSRPATASDREQCTFTPKVNETSEILVELMKDREGERHNNRFEKLSIKDMKRRASIQEEAEVICVVCV